MPGLMTTSAVQRKVTRLCAYPYPRVAKHVPTWHSYRVMHCVPNEPVKLEDIERRVRYVNWADWQNNEIWRIL